MSRERRRKQKFEEKNFVRLRKTNQDLGTTNSTTEKKAFKPIFIKLYVQTIKDAVKFCQLQEKPYYKSSRATKNN